MQDFFSSLALVFIAQIPLLLKLWLDYKDKTNVFRQELFKRQLEAFQSLSADLTTLHENLQCVANIFPDSSLYDDDESLRETANTAYTLAIDAQMVFNKDSVQSDLLLPAALSIAAHEYKHGALRIIECAMNLPTLRQPSRPNMKALWMEQEDRFNIVRNMLRLNVGVDALTSGVFRDVHADGKATLIKRSIHHSMREDV